MRGGGGAGGAFDDEIGRLNLDRLGGNICIVEVIGAFEKTFVVIRDDAEEADAGVVSGNGDGVGEAEGCAGGKVRGGLNCAEESIVSGEGVAGEEEEIGPGAVGDSGAGVANFPDGLEGLVRRDDGWENDGVDDEVGRRLEDCAAAIFVFELGASGVAQGGEVGGGFVDGDTGVAN